MKIRNLISSVLVSSSLVLPLAATAHADHGVQLSDIDGPGVYAKDEIQVLTQNGIINGFEDGTFRPGNAMTRAEFAAILTRALGLTQDASASAQFTDVDPWASGYVGALVNAGITNGVGSTQFDAQAPVSRQDLAVFMMRAMGYEKLANSVNIQSDFADFNQIWDYAKADVALSQKIGFIRGQQDDSGSLVFAPMQNAERQAVARLVYQLYTNGSQFKAQLSAIQKTDEVMAKSANSMDELNSFEVIGHSHGSDNSQLDLIVDMNQSPLTMHGSVSLSVYGSVASSAYGSVASSAYGSQESTVASNAYGNEDSSVSSSAYGSKNSYEFYYRDGIRYVHDLQLNQWKKQMVGDLSQLGKDDMTIAHSQSPYFNLTENDSSYVLMGTFDQKSFARLLTAGSSSLFVNLTPDQLASIKSVQYIYTIDKSTFRQSNVTYTVTYLSGDSVTMSLTPQKFNQVDPIQIPQEALNAQ